MRAPGPHVKSLACFTCSMCSPREHGRAIVTELFEVCSREIKQDSQKKIREKLEITPVPYLS